MKRFEYVSMTPEALESALILAETDKETFCQLTGLNPERLAQMQSGEIPVSPWIGLILRYAAEFGPDILQNAIGDRTKPKLAAGMALADLEINTLARLTGIQPLRIERMLDTRNPKHARTLPPTWLLLAVSIMGACGNATARQYAAEIIKVDNLDPSKRPFPYMERDYGAKSEFAPE